MNSVYQYEHSSERQKVEEYESWLGGSQIVSKIESVQVGLEYQKV